MSEQETDESGLPVLKGVEIVALKVEMDLVPEWSNVVERIGASIGERVAAGFLDGEYTVKVALRPEQKAHFYAEIQRFWKMYTVMRKQQGRWRKG